MKKRLISALLMMIFLLTSISLAICEEEKEVAEEVYEDQTDTEENTESTEEIEIKDHIHSIVYVKNNEINHLNACITCDYYEEENHRYINGMCLCGEEEPFIAERIIEKEHAGVRYTIEGKIPEEAYVVIEEIKKEEYEEMVGLSQDILMAVDISIYINNKEWEPSEGDNITIRCENIELDSENIQVQRIEDDAVTYMDIIDMEDNEITFITDHFTVFLIVSGGYELTIGETTYKTAEATRTYESNNTNVYWFYPGGIFIIVPKSGTDGAMEDYSKIGDAPWKGLLCGYVYFAEGISHVGSNSFSQNTTNTNTVININENELTIGKTAFYGRTINSIEGIKNVTRIEESAFGSVTFTIGELYFEKIEYLGLSAFNNTKGLTKVTFADNTIKVLGENPIQNASSIFSGSTDLAEVKLPNNLEKIGTSVFSGCTSLGTIDIPESVDYIGANAFYGCKNLKSIYIPNSVTNINSKAFAECTSLSSIDGGINLLEYSSSVPLKGLNPDAFLIESSSNSVNTTVNGKSKALLNYDWEGSNRNVSFTGIDSDLTINGISYMYKDATKTYESNNTIVYYFYQGRVFAVVPKEGTDGAMADYTSITDLPWKSLTGYYVYFADGVSHIGDYAFSYITSDLNTVIDLNRNTLSIGNYAFTGRTFKTMTGIENVTSIGTQAFARTEFENLELNFGKKLTYIDQLAFTNVKGLRKITFSNESIKAIGGRQSADAGNMFKACTDLAEVILPEDLEVIGFGIFQGCTSLRKINIPESVDYIGGSAFQETAIESITIPNGIVTINSSTFYGCKNLKSIYIPDSVVNINYRAFAECTSLTEIEGGKNLLVYDSTVSYKGLHNQAFQISDSSKKVKTKVNGKSKALYENDWASNNREVEFTNLSPTINVGGRDFELSKATESYQMGNTKGYWYEAFNMIIIYPDEETNGAMADYETKEDSPFNGKEAKYIFISDGVTHIGKNAFYNAQSKDSTTEVIIKDSVKSIGENAFNANEDGYSISVKADGLILDTDYKFNDVLKESGKNTAITEFCAGTRYSGTYISGYKFSYTVTLPMEVNLAKTTTQFRKTFDIRFNPISMVDNGYVKVTPKANTYLSGIYKGKETLLSVTIDDNRLTKENVEQTVVLTAPTNNLPADYYTCDLVFTLESVVY